MSAIAIPARVSAWREASTGPRPMISGDSAVTPEETMRARGVRPSSAGLTSLINTAVGECSRRDLAPPEPVGDGSLGQILRPHAELVLLLAGDTAQPGDIFR